MGKKNICLKCNKEFLSHHNHAVYCSRGCEIEHKTSEKYKYYLEHQPDFCFDRDMKFIKKHILIEQENKCKICSMKNIWNEKKIVFILDHIDGNATNNLRNNLRLICPNCDSQLDTFKSKNKNSARKNRYLKNYKN